MVGATSARPPLFVQVQFGQKWVSFFFFDFFNFFPEDMNNQNKKALSGRNTAKRAILCDEDALLLGQRKIPATPQRFDALHWRITEKSSLTVWFQLLTCSLLNSRI
ncbi:MAG: hypothetical protein Q4G66_11365 [bacterium]|nr:hypothetical protein [bacterium]